MKGVILGLFVISAAFCTVNAYVAASAPLTHPDHPGKCWNEDKQEAYEVGSSHHPDGQCLEIFCGDDFSLSYVSCGLAYAGPGFHYENNPEAHFPGCCPQIVPDKSN